MNDLTIVLIVLGLLVATVAISALCDRLFPAENKPLVGGKSVGLAPRPANEGRPS